MKGNKKKRERLTPDQLDANYNKYMKAKGVNNKDKKVFEKVLKKAVKKN